jgi:dTDP-4-amino-4,6-dideoxygalactose transaminase
MVLSPTMAVPLVDLAAQYSTIEEEIDDALRRVIHKGDFVLGEAVREFEAAFANYCGVPHAVGVGSGTDALFLAMKALNLGPGDEVIVPAMTFVATAEPVMYCGARPVFVDVRADDLLMDASRVEAAITPRTRGILPVHLYGMPADMDTLGDIARRHGLWLVEDAAQAHGATLNGRRIGGFGSMACFSFYPGKNLGAYGDGGAVVTTDADLAARLRLLRDHGSRAKYQHAVVGYCSRLDTLQAAVLNVKLSHLDGWNAARRAAAARYDSMLGDRLEHVGLAHRKQSVHHIYAVRVPNGRRDRVRERLVAAGIGAGVHYPIPVHQQEAFAELGCASMSMPVAEKAGRELLSLPLYPEITEVQQRYVVDELFDALAHN